MTLRFAVGTQYYVPVTILNYFTPIIPNGFQVQIGIASDNYIPYVATDLSNSNWQDGNGNILNSWLESGEVNTSANTIYWVNIGNNTIAGGGGTLTIYYCLYSKDTNVFSATGPTGAEPTYTGTYGQYDNGANVFTSYTNFSGTSIPAGFTSLLNTGCSITYNNGATLATDSTFPHFAILYYNTQIDPGVLDIYMISMTNGSNSGSLNMGWSLATPTLTGSGSIGSSYDGYDFEDRFYSNYGSGKLYIWPNGYTTGYAVIDLYSTYSFFWSVPYQGFLTPGPYSGIFQNNTTKTYGPSYPMIAAESGTAAESIVIRWMRTRLCPYAATGVPSNPNSTLGSLTPTGINSLLNYMA